MVPCDGGKAAQVGSCRDPQPAPDPDTVTKPTVRAGASVSATIALGQPPATLLALLADPGIAVVADTGIPHVLVPAGLVRNLLDVLAMFVGEYDADPATWPDAEVSKLAAAHAVLARATGCEPIAKGPVHGTHP